MYGRARRIRLFIIIVAIILVAVTIFFVISSLTKDEEVKYSDDNTNFRYLIDYFVSRNYACEMLQKSGGNCSLTVNDKFYQFTRYDNGFEYVFRTNNYILIIKHTSTNGDSVVFKTNNNAVSGYKSKEYTCKMKENIIGEIDECTDSDGNQLELAMYLGVIEQSVHEINNIIRASGYDTSKLIQNYVWEK